MRTQPIRRATITTMVAALALCAAPTHAFASTTTTLTHTDFVALLDQIKIATAAAEGSGWAQLQGSTMPVGPLTISVSVQYDTTLGRSAQTLSSTSKSVSIVAQSGAGTWRPLRSDTVTLSALKLLHQTNATHVLSPNATTELQSVRAQAASVQLLELATISDVAQVVTNDDGTIDYSGAAIDPVFGPLGTWGLRTTTAGAVIGESQGPTNASAPGAFTETNVISYGPQNIALPSATKTVTLANLTKATSAVQLPQTVHGVAGRVARWAATVASHAHRGILPSDVVAASQWVVAGATVRITVTVLKKGVRLSAVNPYTHAIVVNTVLVELAPIVHGGG